MSRR
jgi:putative transposase